MCEESVEELCGERDGVFEGESGKFGGQMKEFSSSSLEESPS